jgi:hypothetical protein
MEVMLSQLIYPLSSKRVQTSPRSRKRSRL